MQDSPDINPWGQACTDVPDLKGVILIHVTFRVSSAMTMIQKCKQTCAQIQVAEKEERAPNPSCPQRMGMGLDKGCKMRQKVVSCTFGESTMVVGRNVNRNSCTGAFSVAL